MELGRTCLGLCTLILQIIIILKLFKFQISSDIVTSENELRGVIDLHAKSEGTAEEKDMLHGILDLDNLQVKEIMTHKKNLEVLNINESTNKNLEKRNHHLLLG